MIATWACGLLAVLFGAAVVQPAHAGEAGLVGTKTITLVSAGGDRVAIGSVDFVPEGDGARLTVKVDSAELKDEFLSMRPFRCLRDAKEWWCHLAYPYELTGRVTAADLTDLEYSLLFIGKGPNFFGIDAWNGLYFKLSMAADGSIAGQVHETDLNVLAVPPADRKARLIVPEALTAVEPGAHRFSRVEIK
ncbi:MAG: hypothetical protein ABL901_18700 [Hyphomicrobiaceae bacterium]